MIKSFRFSASSLINFRNQFINTKCIGQVFYAPKLLTFPLLKQNFTQLEKGSDLQQSVDKQTKKKKVMSKIVKKSSSVSESEQSQSSVATQKTKKQAQLGDFFAGIKKKPEAEVEDKVEINTELGDGIWKDRSSIKIACWNVNGLRAVLKREDLQKYIKQENPDILCLNETKIDESNFLKEKVYKDIPSGYYQYWNFCIPPIKGYSGVSIFSKEKVISIKRGIDIAEHENEGRVLTAEFEKFYLVVVYVPNAGSELVRLDYRVNSFDKDFQNYLNQLKLKKNVILCGDLNVAHKEIDIANPKSNKNSPGFTIEERNSFSKFLDSGWIDTFRYLYPETIKYSWWSVRTKARESNIGWRIDYFVVNQEFKSCIKDSMINNNIYGSDHCPVEFILNLDAIQSTNQSTKNQISSNENQQTNKSN
ncbi:hypothetical protein ABPG74_016667 [Tetrahymena malaccensis]